MYGKFRFAKAHFVYEDKDMTEINPNLKPVQPQVKVNAEQTPTEVPVEETDVKVSEQQMDERSLDKMPQATIGKSQVRKAETIEDDLKQFTQNPEACQKAMEVGEQAQKNLEAKGDEEAALKALNVEKAYVEEFAN